jgi:hypothetical protein
MRKGREATRKGEKQNIKKKRESKEEEKNRAMREGVRVAYWRGFERATERKVQNNKVVKMI